MSPTPRGIELPSKNQINKCGRYLQQFHGPRSEWPDGYDNDEIERAAQVVADFRAAHAYPMQKVRMGLLSMVRTAGAEVAVTQRLKRVPRIVRKLYRHREHSTMLARLEDIGGVRAVVGYIKELERVRARVTRQWRGGQLKRDRDYIAEPKAMGYRAVHLVVMRNERAIEVQLRTRGQQRWADAVEAIDSRLRLNLKDEDGPEALVGYFRATGEIIHLNELGMDLPADVRRNFVQARDDVVAEGFYTR